MIAGAFLDELYFAAIRDRESGARLLRNVKDTLLCFLDVDIETYVIHNVYSLPLGFAGLCLYEVIYQEHEKAGLDRFDARDIALAIDRCEHYVAPDNVRRQYSFSPSGDIPNETATYDTIWIDEANGTYALIVSDDYKSGLRSATSDGLTKQIFFLTEAAHFLAMVRTSLANSQSPDDDFTRYARIAFPDVIFASGLVPSSTRLDLGQHMKVFVDHMAFLCDHFIPIGIEANWDSFTIQKRCEARGVDLSGESTRTKHTQKKIKQREVSVELAGKMQRISCTMHTKLTRDQGRIHFSVEHVNAARRMVIGIICDHLDT